MKIRGFTKIKGFTLIELLVVIGAMAVLGVIFSNILIQTLRGGNKARVLNQVKQNGQVVLEKLTQEIRQAEKVICVDNRFVDTHLGPSVPTDTIVIFKQGVYTRFRFYSPKPADNPPTDGYIAWDNPGEENDPCTSAQIFPLIPTPTTPPPQSQHALNVESSPTPIPLLPLSFAQYLTDTDPVSGISLNYAGDEDFTDKIFKKDSKPGFGDTVTVKFRTTAGVEAGQAYETTVSEGGILFTTTVVVRGGK